jgi:hypothetical protein
MERLHSGELKGLFRRILSVLPEAYKSVKLEDFINQPIIHQKSDARAEAFDILKRFCRSDYWSLSFCSTSTGIGKTRLGLFTLACLALKGKFKTREIHTIQDAGYFSALDVARIMHGEKFKLKRPNTNMFYAARVLMIDDLGQEEKHDAGSLAAIIKYREENGKKTILTTNLTLTGLNNRYTERLASRIYAGMFEMKGIDRRL